MVLKHTGIVFLFVCRIYNVATDCEQPEKVYALGGQTVTDDVDPGCFSPSRVAIALGETAVSFDFGSPIGPSGATNSTADHVGLGGHHARLWPIYVLLGNGEVYRMLTSLETKL
jgi:Nuclear pore component